MKCFFALPAEFEDVAHFDSASFVSEFLVKRALLDVDNTEAIWAGFVFKAIKLLRACAGPVGPACSRSTSSRRSLAAPREEESLDALLSTKKLLDDVVATWPQTEYVLL